ncbi:MAG: ComF family protein [Candidatus Omnitrophica bacterium]|nr:ComF family protein [Candidatus Omnitrophota bacterium]
MLRGFLNTLTDIVYPKVCIACKRHLKGITSVDELVCGECWKKIKKNAPPFCRSCGRHLERPVTKSICPACVRKSLYFDRAFSPCVYEGVIKDLIHAFKYRGKDHLGPALGNLMAQFVEDYTLPMDMMDLIIPVPLHKTRLREREFNQAAVLSSHVAGKFKKEMSPEALKRVRNTKTQTDLQPDKRLLNVKGSIAVSAEKDLKGKNILLIDDVLTTGATCSEAALALKNAGANIVFVLTLAN